MQTFDSQGRLKVALGAGSELIDNDLDTYVRVEQTPDDDIVRFGTAGVERATIGATGIFSFQEYLTHLGDLDTYLRFTPDRLRVEVGGVDILDIIPGAVVWNEAGADVDFRWEGAGAPNAFFIQGSDGKVGIGTNTPIGAFHAAGSYGNFNINLVALADEASVALETVIAGRNGFIDIATNEAVGGIVYIGGAAELVTIVSDPHTKMSNADVDGKICVLDDADGTYTLKNRLGGARDFILMFRGIA